MNSNLIWFFRWQGGGVNGVGRAGNAGNISNAGRFGGIRSVGSFSGGGQWRSDAIVGRHQFGCRSGRKHSYQSSIGPAVLQCRRVALPFRSAPAFALPSEDFCVYLIHLSHPFNWILFQWIKFYCLTVDPLIQWADRYRQRQLPAITDSGGRRNGVGAPGDGRIALRRKRIHQGRRLRVSWFRWCRQMSPASVTDLHW